MSNEVTAHIDVGDLSRLRAQLERAERELGKSASDALKWAMGTLLASVKASTLQAPKKRKVIANPDPRAQTDKRVAKYVAVAWRGGAETLIPMKERDGKARNIKRSGLARAAWSWGLKAIGQPGSSTGSTDQRTTQIAKNNMTVEKHLTGGPEMFIAAANRLDYAMLAMKGGEMAVTTAADRAAKSLEYKIDRALYGAGLADRK